MNAWNPDLHPRNKRGEFVKVLEALKPGDHVSLPGGTHVRRDGSRYTIKGRQGNVVANGLNKLQAAEHALRHDAKQREVAPSAKPTSADLGALRTGQPFQGRLYHGTTSSSADAIRRGGFVFDQESTTNTWGPGIYLTDKRSLAEHYSDFNGGGVVVVQTHLDNPFVATRDEAKAALANVKKQDVPAHLKGMGHDALIVRHPSGAHEVITWNPHNLSGASA